MILEWHFLVLITLAGGVFNSLFLAFFAVRKRHLHFLAILLLSIFLILLDTTVVYTGFFRHAPHLVSMVFPLLFITGPLYYLFIRSKLTRNFYLMKSDLLILIPLIVAIVDHWGFYKLGTEDKIQLLNSVFSQCEGCSSPRFLVMMTFKIFVNGIYSYAALTLTYPASATPFTKGDKRKLKVLRNLSKVFLGYWSFYLVGFLLLFLFNQYSVMIDTLFFVGLSFLVHGIAVSSLLHPQSIYLPFSAGYFNNENKSSNSQEIIKQLEVLMRTHKLFLNPELKLADLANGLTITSNELSLILNRDLQTSFTDYVNQYRIETAKELLLDPESRRFTILFVAHESGFSGKSSFNRIFKKHTQLTPSEFIDENPKS